MPRVILGENPVTNKKSQALTSRTTLVTDESTEFENLNFAKSPQTLKFISIIYEQDSMNCLRLITKHEPVDVVSSQDAHINA